MFQNDDLNKKARPITVSRVRKTECLVGNNKCERALLKAQRQVVKTRLQRDFAACVLSPHTFRYIY